MNSYGWPTPSHQNAILRKKVEKGEISKENVMELRLIRDSPYYAPINVMVMKNASVDDLRKSLSELMGYHVGIVHVGFFDGDPNIILGWSGDVKNNSRSYNGNQKLTDLGVVNGTILKEVDLPLTKQEIQREDERRKKEMEEWKTKTQEREKKMREYQQQRRDTRKEREMREMQRMGEMQRGIDEEEQDYAEFLREAREEWVRKQWEEAQRKRGEQAGQTSSSSSRPQMDVPVVKKSCEQKLRELEITSKKEFKKWTHKGHPNRGGNLTIFQEISSCNDEMERLYGDNWDLEKKRGGRRKSRTARIKRSVRKHRGTHKKKSHT